MNSIYSISFARTKTVFPLVWSRDLENAVYAVNVTDRYAPPTSENAQADPSKIQVRIRVWNADQTERVATKVSVISAKQADQQSDTKTELSGTSPSNTADMNDMLEFELQRGANYQLQIQNGENLETQSFTTTDEVNQLIEVRLTGKAVSQTTE